MQRGIEGSWGDGDVLYLDCGRGYVTMYICQNLQSHNIKKGEF